jgi:hypothetical protein
MRKRSRAVEKIQGCKDGKTLRSGRESGLVKGVCFLLDVFGERLEEFGGDFWNGAGAEARGSVFGVGSVAGVLKKHEFAEAIKDPDFVRGFNVEKPGGSANGMFLGDTGGAGTFGVVILPFKIDAELGLTVAGFEEADFGAVFVQSVIAFFVAEFVALNVFGVEG